MAIELKRAVDYYINYSNKIPDSRKELVREKMLTSEWIPCAEQNPPPQARVLARYIDGSVCIGWNYGFLGNGTTNITHWKPLIK